MRKRRRFTDVYCDFVANHSTEKFGTLLPDAFIYVGRVTAKKEAILLRFYHQFFTSNVGLKNLKTFYVFVQFHGL